MSSTTHIQSRRRPLSSAAGALAAGWVKTPQGRLRLRRAASRIIRIALRLRSRPFLPAQAPSVLVVAPHPDDETFGCGGAVALLARCGRRVHVTFVTSGGASHPDHPSVTPVELAARRSAEAIAAIASLGVAAADVSFLEVEDGTLARLSSQLADETVAKLAAVVAKVGPGAILLPMRRDGSSEHDATFSFLLRAVEEAATKPRLLEFPVWSWWNPILLIRPLFTYRRIWRADLRPVEAVKAVAIGAYASQTLPLPPDTAAALPAGFSSMFLCGEEFLFER